jgi:hypothetical protein
VVVLEHVRRTGRVFAEPRREGEIAVEPHDCAGSAVHDVTMFGSLSRPGEPQPPNHQFNVSNSHSTVVPANAGTTIVNLSYAPASPFTSR